MAVYNFQMKFKSRVTTMPAVNNQITIISVVRREKTIKKI